MIINKLNQIYIKLEQLRCLNKDIRKTIALLPLSIVIPLTSMSILVGSHALPKNKITYGIIKFFIV